MSTFTVFSEKSIKELLSTMFTEDSLIGNNSFLPITFLPKQMDIDEDFQLIDDTKCFRNAIKNYWTTSFCACLLGQLAVHRKSNFFVTGQIDLFKRNPTQKEADADTKKYGYQIIGERLKPQDKDTGTEKIVEFLGTKYPYKGMRRITKCVFRSRILRVNSLPNDTAITSYQNDINKHYGDAKSRNFECNLMAYIRYIGDGNSEVSILITNNSDAYRAVNLQKLCYVHVDNLAEKLLIKDFKGKETNYSFNYWAKFI